MPRPRRTFAPVVVAEMVRLYSKHRYSIVLLAKDFETSPRAVRRTLVEAGVLIRRRGGGDALRDE